jgi:flagellar biosynthesis/type III secretory pathway chaperone
MTKKEREKLIDTLDVWVKECETFYNSFKDVFSERPDAVEELKCKCGQTNTINEFLFSGKFITMEKYLEVCDRLEKLELKENE